jgi:hypothetical protein
VPWKWLNFFLEDDERLARIGEEYGSGRMLTGDIKAELVQVGAHGSWPAMAFGARNWRALFSWGCGVPALAGETKAGLVQVSADSRPASFGVRSRLMPGRAWAGRGWGAAHRGAQGRGIGTHWYVFDPGLLR